MSTDAPIAIRASTRSALEQVVHQCGPVKGGTSVPVLIFIVLRAAGTSRARAYKFIRPDVTDRSARQLGMLLNRSCAQHIEALRVNPALLDQALADLQPYRVMADLQASPRDALTAADQINRRYGRYAPDAAVNVFTGLDGLLGTVADAEPAPLCLPQDVGLEPADDDEITPKSS